MKEQVAQQVYGGIVIPMEDDIIHTEENNYQCEDDTCPCNELADTDGDVILLKVNDQHYLAITRDVAGRLLDRLLLLMAQPEATH